MISEQVSYICYPLEVSIEKLHIPQTNQTRQSL